MKKGFGDWSIEEQERLLSIFKIGFDGDFTKLADQFPNQTVYSLNLKKTGRNLLGKLFEYQN
jgi:hypothetical protein